MTPLPEIENRKSIYSWALYDWANSAFATTVIAGFFPIFFKTYWSAGDDVTLSTLRLGTANSAASIAVALLAPFLGAIADKGSAKKRFLFFFALMGVVMTSGLYLVSRGAWQLAIAVFVAASIGFSASIIFYDSLLVSVAETRRTDYVSALGYSLGYLGGGVLFAVNVLMTLHPHWFGLADASQAVRLSFILVALWWAVFSIPLMLFVKEPRGEASPGWETVKAGVHQLGRTFGDLRRLRVVFLFLIAYFLYIDGVQTIARMGVDYGLSLGFEANSLIVALLITQFVGFPAALFFGKIGERIGAKTGIYIGITVYVGTCVFGFFMKTVTDFYILAITIGLVQGGVQSLSRSLYSRLIPTNKAAEFFGFYNMLGKFSTMLGPILMGWVGVLTGNPRFSVLSVAVLLIAGGLLLVPVSEQAGRRAASRMETP
ncbi:MAG: MFS transporter [Candidatus Krumholzibacteriia bacterium]